MGSSSSKFSGGGLELPEKVAVREIPPSFHLTNTRVDNQLVFKISTRGAEPFRAVVKRKPKGTRTVLYSTKKKKAKPVVYAVKKKHDFTIYLPEVISSGIMACQATMRRCSRSDRYQFSFMVGHKNSYRNEAFEWRRTGEKEMIDLGMTGSGWKLVRLGPTIGRDDLPPYSRDGRHQHGRKVSPQDVNAFLPEKNRPIDSDSEYWFLNEGEVVAVLADDAHRPGRVQFQYRGSGNSVKIGYHWGLMAAMSAICILQRQPAKELGVY